jgi:hypothetical protein
MKRLPYISPSEYSDRAIVALENATAADALLTGYRTPINDLIRDFRYQRNRAETAESRADAATSRADRLAAKLAQAERELRELIA